MRCYVTVVLPGNSMFRRYPFVMGLLLLLLSFPLSAAYITDKLLAGVYEKPEVSTAPLQLLPSGTPVELLKTEGTFTQVRLPNRGEGWIESRFISDEKPAQVMLLELQAATAELRRKVQQAETALEQGKATSPEQITLKGKLSESQQQVKTLTQELQDVKTQLNNKHALLALPLWLLPTAGLLLLLGFISGIIFRNYRLSKRFGGLRL